MGILNSIHNSLDAWRERAAITEANQRHREEIADLYEMFRNGEISRTELRDAEARRPRPPRRTMYAIRLKTGHWVGLNHKWVDSWEGAMRYATMTTATIAAITEIGLAPEDFTVEAV